MFVAAFHDTFFAYTLRLAFGSRFFPHSDERELPVVWHIMRETQTSPRHSIQLTLNDVPNPDARSITSEATVIANTPAKADSETGQDALLIDWYGPTDPDSSWKKAWIMFQTCLLTFAVYLGSAIYTAGLPGVTSEFHVSNVTALVGLTVFVAGYELGPMVWAPLSEVPQIFRMPIYIFTLAVFVVLQVPTALATNYGWRWTIWEILWLSGLTLVLLFFFFPETSASNILYRRAQRLRKVTGNPSIKSASEIAAATMTPRDVAVDILVRPFSLNFQEPIVLVLNVYIGLIYALLYIWFESFLIVFVGIYHWREQMLGLSFLGIFVGVFMVIPPFFAYLYFVQEPKYNEKGELKPEERMPIAIVGALIVPICLLWFGWALRASVHWIVPIIGSSLFGTTSFLLNYLADAYPTYAASVLAGNDFIRSMFGAAFPLFADAMYRNLGVGWASTLLALLACAFIPISILLYKYGEMLRVASRRARHDYN
ncbi:multidrug resistance protein-like protein [Lactarius akahatsu]|uniref:Multidrug resistance protein-like protein n=1 Tax=Lactarius akahatsu TaxID=416441 RepID=A0AAD4LBF7_9AGAM|nr:multidrug resistance protein-like protein [Lactarius akahatsu]